mmetsp:Transcript_11076/g.16575  ORF Transcript_11076/g.16575 Transcript_11076/m.16575 type:complete len:133 (-) Transcript_11076:227-625(-)|eukprot:CAMPEP_0167752576 /NCGR_PEP_ID=MMETSP0110_2-20121227/7218_1 /TAXON_ID=629695 /ORGANISM="Gymnochlora sp., Strain CCMP2014" /LENGTH=132 /DNA_ID=CAMNT_0007638213 /DNA_START=192 /DNA_END=590 /DNA_ORIENTATION=-
MDTKKSREAKPDSKRTTEDIEKATVAKIFDEYDKTKSGFIEKELLTSLCFALGIKPWHLIRSIKTKETEKDGKKITVVTKEALIEYWMDPSRPKPVAKKSKTKKPTKADVAKAFRAFKKALEALEETVLASY